MRAAERSGLLGRSRSRSWSQSESESESIFSESGPKSLQIGQLSSSDSRERKKNQRERKQMPLERHVLLKIGRVPLKCEIYPDTYILNLESRSLLLRLTVPILLHGIKTETIAAQKQEFNTATTTS